jgi:hypothetical protein
MHSNAQHQRSAHETDRSREARLCASDTPHLRLFLHLHPITLHRVPHPALRSSPCVCAPSLPRRQFPCPLRVAPIPAASALRRCPRAMCPASAHLLPKFAPLLPASLVPLHLHGPQFPLRVASTRTTSACWTIAGGPTSVSLSTLHRSPQTRAEGLLSSVCGYCTCINIYKDEAKDSCFFRNT